MTCESCGHTDKEWLRQDQLFWLFQCPSCKEGMYRIERAVRQPRGYTFQPMVTEDITGSPLELRSPKHRDRVLAAHNLTMDRYSEAELSQRRAAFREKQRVKIDLPTLRSEWERNRRQGA